MAHHDTAFRELLTGKLSSELARTQRGLPCKPGEASAMRDDKSTYERKPASLFDGCRLSSPLHQGIQAR